MTGPGLARTYSISVVGIEGHLVDVETYAGAGLVAFTLVGLLDTSVREARDRVRAAFESCGLDVLDQRITVNLSPAGIPKSGSGFDLAIASSIALATGLVYPRAFQDAVIVGELALDGSIQPVRGVLPAVLAARSRGVRRVIVPEACAREARLVDGIEVIAFAHLADLIAWGGGEAIKAPFHGHLGMRAVEPGRESPAVLDMADVRGQGEAVGAMEVAAAGGHHVFLIGEPGSGKTMLASRLPTILPDLDADTALVTTSLHSVAGLVPAGTALVTRPPFQAPHHSVTMAALIGGGSRTLTPGAASLAHGGILFLDEAAEFAPSVLGDPHALSGLVPAGHGLQPMPLRRGTGRASLHLFLGRSEALPGAPVGPSPGPDGHSDRRAHADAGGHGLVYDARLGDDPPASECRARPGPPPPRGHALGVQRPASGSVDQAPLGHRRRAGRPAGPARRRRRLLDEGSGPHAAPGVDAGGLGGSPSTNH